MLKLLTKCLLFLFFCKTSIAYAEESKAKIYVLLWFDTEDYLLPESDDAALKLAKYLTEQNVPATFKVVGEKIRTLEMRQRKDVITALAKHDIGYHSNFHSIHPTPAAYCSNLNWDEGINEFLRREQQGALDLKRVFGKTPSCYGQPGSSWAPQSYPALKEMGIPVYLDAGNHVNLNESPCYYAGILNLYKLKHTFRPNLDNLDNLETAKQRFIEARSDALKNGHSIVSTYYHPCELVHKEFWDGVNFRGGANPPRQLWKLPSQKSPEEKELAFRIFHEWIQFLKRFPETTFISASQAHKLFTDTAQKKMFPPMEASKVRQTALKALKHQHHDNYSLSCAEVFSIMNQELLRMLGETKALPTLPSQTILGPTSLVKPVNSSIETDISQIRRTCMDVQNYLSKHSKIPSAIWLGSQSIDPASYLAGIIKLLDQGESALASDKFQFQPAYMEDESCIEKDETKLWKWVIFPPGFKPTEMMQLAKQQAWTLKPAIAKKAFLSEGKPDKP